MEIPVKAAAAGLVVLAVFSALPAFGILPTLRLVTNTNDSGDGSLRQTIIDADFSNTGDTIMFDSGVTGTITLTSGDLLIEHSLTIIGPGVSTLAISGGNTSQVFIVNSGATVSISGLTVENGNSGGTGTDGGGIQNFGALTMTNCTLSGNIADRAGGGIFNSGTMTLTNSTVSANSAVGGGGIFDSGTLTVTNSTLSIGGRGLPGRVYPL
jgi:hypothetical protein